MNVAPDNTALIEGLRREAKQSLYFFARAIVKFKEMAPGFHGDLCRFIERTDAKRKLILAPRGHFKSSVTSIAYPTWRVINDPNIRILLTNATATNAEHFLRRIKAIFEKNDVFQMLFPEVIPTFDKNTKWSSTEIQVPRTVDFPEATIETLGVGGRAASRHYNVQIKDDLINEETAESIEGMEHVIAHHQYSEGLFDRPEDGEDIVIGTRWAFNDYYEWLIKRDGRYAHYIRSAVEDGRPIFPERFSVASLADIERVQGPYKYACQYLNSPADASVADFKVDWLRYYKFDEKNRIIAEGVEKPIKLESLHVYAQVDPAITEDKRRSDTSRNAITVEGIDKDDRIFLLDVFAERCSPIDLINQMFKMHDQWSPIRWGVEAVAYQKAIRPFVEERMRREGKFLYVEDYVPGKTAKEARIRGLQPYFFDRKVFVRHGMTDFLKEYMQFPVGSTRDILDALAYGPQMWTSPTSEDENEDAEKALRGYLSHVNPITGY